MKKVTRKPTVAKKRASGVKKTTLKRKATKPVVKKRTTSRRSTRKTKKG